MNKKLKRVLIIIGLILIIAIIGMAIAMFMLFKEFKGVVTSWSPSGLDSLPCEPKSQVELGSPYTGGKTAEFSTSGSDLYFIARYFHHGGILDLEKYMAGIYVGPVEKKPSWDTQRNIISNVSMEINFTEGYYGVLTLPVGRYWLWSSSGDVVIYSCEEGGVSDPKPVR
jgi:hypothetical protein